MERNWRVGGRGRGWKGFATCAHKLQYIIRSNKRIRPPNALIGYAHEKLTSAMCVSDPSHVGGSCRRRMDYPS